MKISASLQRYQAEAVVTGAPSRPALGRAADAAVRKHSTTDVGVGFRSQFEQLAADPKAFGEFMRTVFGTEHDAASAEILRQRALLGDFEWLPPVRFVGDGELAGGAALGAYDSATGTIFLDGSLRRDPALAAKVFTEEVGHHLDTMLRTSDSAGDEGELFRRLLGGESLSAEQIKAIRSENDHGVITVDGQQIEAEFFGIFKAIGKAVGGVAKAVGGAVGGVAKAIGGVATGAFDAVKGAAVGLLGSGIGFMTNLFQGRLGDALGALVKGVGDTVLRTPVALFRSLLDAHGTALNGLAGLFGPLAEPVRSLVDRGVDVVRTVGETAAGVADDVLRTMYEAPIEVGRSVLNGAAAMLGGDVLGGLREIGMAPIHGVGRVLGGVADTAIRTLHGAADVVSTSLFLQQPSRPLTESEARVAREIYGDSLDVEAIRIRSGGVTDWFNMAAHVVGNTIHMPSAAFDSNGALTTRGLETLDHELGHVWQSQNGGGDYIHRSLWAQLRAQLGQGDRNLAYDWREPARAGVPFGKLNPEQQASLIGDLSQAYRDDGKVTADDWHNSVPLTADEIEYLREAWDLIRRGDAA